MLSLSQIKVDNMKILPSIFMISLACLLSSCVTVVTPNSCMIDAVDFQVKKKAELAGLWSRILVVEWTDGDRHYAHAWCLYEYPKASGKAWAYDEMGSKFIWLTHDVKECSATEIAAAIHPYFTDAYFAEDADHH